MFIKKKRKKYQGIQRKSKAWPIQRGKRKKKRKCRLKRPMADLLGKDFKITVLKMLKELKEHVEKVKKIT